jgi:hypothetical protein
MKVGLFLTFCLGLFVSLLFVYGNVTREWRGRRELHVVFNTVSGLRPEARVLYNGLEVGRVIKMDLVEMDEPLAALLPQLDDFTLEELPFTDAEREELRGIAPVELDRSIRKKLLGHGVVLLTLEVLAEGDVKRYRENDHVRIVSTLMGESAVQIISGDGAPITPENPRLLIGSSGDMYGALAKSMNQMKDILNSLSEMLGGGGGDDDGEDSSIAQKVTNFSHFTERMEKMADSLESKLPATWDTLDAQLAKGQVKSAELTKTVLEKRPGWEKSLQDTDVSIGKMREDLVKATDEGHQKIVSIRKDTDEMLKPLAETVRTQKGTIPNTIRDAREWTERIDSKVEAIGREMTHFDRKLTQGSESVRQAFHGMVGTADRLEEKLWYLSAYPWSFVRSPAGPVAQALDREWRRALLGRHFRELRSELETAEKEFKPGDRSDQERHERIRQALRELDAFLPKAEAK